MSDSRSDARGAGWGGLRGIPGGIWALGLVSLFMDTSSELIHGLLPGFLVGVLGASAVTLGFIEGVAEAAASLSKLFSGALSDRIGRRKQLTVAGYGLSALTKPLFPLAASAGWVFAARFLDRVGKGVRGAPRDALIAEIAPADRRGACYGLRQSLDTIGAFAGPLLAVVLMAAFAGNVRLVLWMAVVPALLAVFTLVVGVHEPARAVADGTGRRPPRLAEALGLGAPYWILIAVAALLGLARFSEAFLLLRAEGAGLTLTFVPLVLVLMNVVYALSAYPAGWLSDRLDRRVVLAAGIACLIGADVVLALSGGLAATALGVALWGLHLGLTQGLLVAMVSDLVPSRRRGTAFGMFHAVSGVASLLASLAAGVLWERFGPPAAFAAGALVAGLALAGMAAVRSGK